MTNERPAMSGAPALREQLEAVLADLGLVEGATIQSVQRRLHVGTAAAMRLLALRYAIRAVLTGAASREARAEPHDIPGYVELSRVDETSGGETGLYVAVDVPAHLFAVGDEVRVTVEKESDVQRAIQAAVGREPSERPALPNHAVCINCVEPHDSRWFGNGNVGPFCSRCASILAGPLCTCAGTMAGSHDPTCPRFAAPGQYAGAPPPMRTP